MGYRGSIYGERGHKTSFGVEGQVARQRNDGAGLEDLRTVS